MAGPYSLKDGKFRPLNALMRLFWSVLLGWILEWMNCLASGVPILAKA